MKGDLGRAFNELKSSMFSTYKGVLIERFGNKYTWLGFTGTWEEVTERIDQSLQNWSNKIKQQN